MNINKRFSKLIPVMLAILMALALTACAAPTESTAPQTGVTPTAAPSEADTEPTASPTEAPTETDYIPAASPEEHFARVMTAHQKVLRNEMTFWDAERDMEIHLDALLEDVYDVDPDDGFAVRHFSVLDMDGDQIPEIVLEIAHGGSGGSVVSYVILHYNNGRIYGYERLLRGLMELKKDGTHNWSGGAMVSGVAQWQSPPNADIDIMRYEADYDEETDQFTFTFLVNGEEVTEEEFDLARAEQAAKEDAEWHEFTPENVERYLTYE